MRFRGCYAALSGNALTLWLSLRGRWSVGDAAAASAPHAH